MIEKEYLFSPSELDYKAKKCPDVFIYPSIIKLTQETDLHQFFLVLMLYRNLISKILILKVGELTYPVEL